MTHYISIGLGVFLTLSVLAHADPMEDLGPAKTVLAFLCTLFLWPLELGMQLYLAIKMREVNTEVLNRLLSSLESSEKALDGPTSDDQAIASVVAFDRAKNQSKDDNGEIH